MAAGVLACDYRRSGRPAAALRSPLQRPFVTTASSASSSVPRGPRLIHGFAVAALVAGVGRLAGRLGFWLLPYDRLGAANEVALALVGLAVGLVVALRLGRGWPVGAFAGVGVYLVLSLADLGWSPAEGAGFDRHRNWAFSSPQCEFVVRFPRPGTPGQIVRQADRSRPLGRYATLGDVETASSLRADCVIVETGDAAGAGRAALESWISGNAVTVLRREEAVGPLRASAVEGWLAGSILPDDDSGKPRRTLAAVRVYVGRDSVLVVSAMQPVGEAISPATLAFLDAVEAK
jgi:hypothetical protein